MSFLIYFLSPNEIYFTFHVDFKNPNDADDKSFDPHPTEYPFVDLEYPNSGAKERCVWNLLNVAFYHDATIGITLFTKNSFILTQVYPSCSKRQGPL